MISHRSPALTLLFNEIKQTNDITILDLGAITKANFDFLNQFSCKIQVEDLSARISDIVATGEIQLLNSIDQYLGRHEECEPFDVILIWDVINYLSRDGIKKLMQKLSYYAKQDTLLYAIRYLEKKIPTVPQRFHIRDQYTIQVELRDLRDRSFEFVNTSEFLKITPNYTLENTLMNKEGMRHGYIEHLLRFNPGNTSKKLQAVKEGGYDKTNHKTFANTHISPSLEQVCRHLRSKKNSHVLLIGKPISRNTDFFIEHCEGVYHADLYPLLQWQKDTASNRGIQKELLNVDSNVKVDVVVTWDFFNFCDLKQIAQINHFLTNIIQPDALLMSYVYSRKSIPSKPQQFEIMDNNTIGLPEVTQGLESDTELTCGHLLKVLHNFELDASFFYREGMSSAMSEYVFKYKKIAKSA